MKKKSLCFLSTLFFTIIFSISLNAEPSPFFPEIVTPPRPTTIAEPEPETPTITPTSSPEAACPEVSIPATAFNCDDVADSEKITFARRMGEELHETLQSLINDYATHEHGGVYKLCFKPDNLPVTVYSGISINYAADKPVLISGLKIQRAPDVADSNFPLITINSPNPVIFYDVILAGIGPADMGKGLVISGCNHRILNTLISGFGEAVRLEGSKIALGPLFDGVPFDEAKFEAEKVEIFNNKIGLHWVSGEKNRFPFILIHNNAQDPLAPTANDGFMIDGTFTRPEITLSNPDPTKNEGLFCEKDKAGTVVKRYLNFKAGTVSRDMEIVVYESDNFYNQTSNYLLRCTVDDKNNCKVTLPSYLSISDTKCGDPSLFVTALANAADHTPAPTIKAFKLDGPVVALGSDDATITIASSGSSATGEVTGDGVGETATAASGGGSSGGCGGGGQSMAIVPAGSTSPTPPYKGGELMILWWLIFTAPAILVAVRIKKRK